MSRSNSSFSTSCYRGEMMLTNMLGMRKAVAFRCWGNPRAYARAVRRCLYQCRRDRTLVQAWQSDPFLPQVRLPASPFRDIHKRPIGRQNNVTAKFRASAEQQHWLTSRGFWLLLSCRQTGNNLFILNCRSVCFDIWRNAAYIHST